jgi:hypothetical protein
MVGFSGISSPPLKSKGSKRLAVIANLSYILAHFRYCGLPSVYTFIGK